MHNNEFLAEVCNAVQVLQQYEVQAITLTPEGYKRLRDVARFSPNHIRRKPKDDEQLTIRGVKVLSSDNLSDEMRELLGPSLAEAVLAANELTEGVTWKI